MLYVTTRSNDTYTAYRALTNEFGSDKGGFVPFRFPQYTPEQFRQLKVQSFNQIVADILNGFFSLRMSAWDLDLAVGRNLLRIVPMNHRIAVAETWHNPGGNYAYIEKLVLECIEQKANAQPATTWPRIAVKIATLFGIYGQMLRDGVLETETCFDVSVRNDDFLTPIAVMYCRMMGMPVNTIICTCSKDHKLWDFVHRGFMNNTGLSENDQAGIERLLQGTLGWKDAARFRKACAEKQGFEITPENLPILNKGWFCSVAGDDRSQSVINSVYRTNKYFVDAETALCYGGLQDYRAKTGESQLTLILSETTPLRCVEEITLATGLDAEQVVRHIN